MGKCPVVRPARARTFLQPFSWHRLLAFDSVSLLPIDVHRDANGFLKNSGARAALRLLDNQARFLCSVEIGITLIGVLPVPFGGATLAEDLADWLQMLGLRPGTAETVGVAVVVAVITSLSLIVGELVSKQSRSAIPSALPPSWRRR